MPVVDLHSILGPIVGTVAGLVFPDLVTIEKPARTQDESGDVTSTWDTVDDDVPALISPASSSESSVFGAVPILQTDVTILLAGDRDVWPSYRIRNQTPGPDDPDPRQGDRWDVVGVTRDEVKVTTTVLARRNAPGTPDEGS
jgi:head-tail adaptor